MLVNNAGVTRDGLLARMSDDEWREVIETNLSAVFYTCRAVTRPMMKRRAGAIVVSRMWLTWRFSTGG